ncbi:TPA: RHS repeat-associated core domain-containing protein, partial [Enterobacter cloacae]
SWQGKTGIVMGIFGLLITVVSAGTAISACLAAEAAEISTGGVISGLLGTVSDASAIASGVMEDRVPPYLTETLSWVSLATGVVGIGTGVLALRSAIAARRAAYTSHTAEGLSADERRFYNYFRRKHGMTHDQAAEAAKRMKREYNGDFENSTGQRENASADSQRQRASFHQPRMNSRPRTNNSTPNFHRNDVSAQADVNLSSTHSHLDNYPLIRNIIDNPNEPFKVFPGGLSRRDFKFTYLKVHPDKFPSEVKPYASRAFIIFKGWENQLINESSV